MKHRISVILVQLKTFHEIAHHPLDVLGANSKRMDLQCWMISARMLKVYSLGPVTRFYLLTRDFDGTSPWLQGCRASQYILEPRANVTFSLTLIYDVKSYQ